MVVALLKLFFMVSNDTLKGAALFRKSFYIGYKTLRFC